MSTINLSHRCKLPKGSAVQLHGIYLGDIPSLIDTIDSERDIYFEAGTTLEHVYPDQDKSVVRYSYQVVTPQTVYKKRIVYSIVFNIIQLVEL